MPVLRNPRHEAFARAIFVGLCSPNIYPTRGHAYNAAGYRAKDAGKPGGSAEVAACNLLKKIKIFDRVRENKLQNVPQSQPTSVFKNSINSERMLTQTKPMARQWPQLWEKRRF
jgi:hypothetical protein